MSKSPAVDAIRAWSRGQRPRLAIVLGSSLDAVAASVSDARSLSYRDIPGFPRPSVSGHAGQLVIGRLGGCEVLIAQGRAHAYETGRMDAMRPVVEALAARGVETLVLTNAAGSVDPRIGEGRLMLITDHINFSGTNPLTGDIGDERFVTMTDAYDPALCRRMRAAARAERIDLAEGVYMYFCGPSFETPAEIRMARVLGAQAVGMSTVPETILARRFGLCVAGVSGITNLAAGIEGSAPTHEHTGRVARILVEDMTRLLERFAAGFAAGN